MMFLAMALAAASPSPVRAADAVDAVATNAGFAGEVLVAKGNRVLLDKGYGAVAPNGRAKHRAGSPWRLASISKQITAALVVRQFAMQRRSLDQAIDFTAERHLALPKVRNLAGLTARQLLTHHTGLANPDETPVNAEGVPAFYRDAGDAPRLDLCETKTAQPGAPFSYNNCDYLVLGALLSPHAPDVVPAGIYAAGPLDRGVPGFVHGQAEPQFSLANWGAAGGMIGTARALFSFDRSLMTGKLLKPAALAELWKPEGGRSYQALGQWVFPGSLKGCATQKRIVQRDGEIYGVQTRNFILPDDDLVVIMFTNRSSDDFPIGEIWQGKGFAFDLLSAVACA